MAKIRTFKAGHCTHPSCMALKGSGFASRCFPSQAYLIESKEGLVLWDTGYASRFMDATSSGIYRAYGWITPVYFDESEALVKQLKEEGVSPADISGVVLSHFHADHMAGLRDFPNAKVICCAHGWATHRGLSGLGALRRAFLPVLLPQDIDSRILYVQSFPEIALPEELQPFGTGWKLGNDLVIVNLPGHAVGHLGAFVQDESGWTLLASDAAWAAEGYRELRGPSELSFLIQENRKEYYVTLKKLHELHKRGTSHILLTHESASSA